MALGTLPSAADEAGPQAQMAPRRRPLHLPPPTKAAGEEEEEALRNERLNDDDDEGDPAAANVKAAGAVAAALSAMHDAAAAAAASSSSAGGISAAGTRSSAFQAKGPKAVMASAEMLPSSGTGAAAALAPASSLDQRPLPPVHSLPSTPTRSAVATLLRDHLGAPLAASDPIRECDPLVLEELPRNPREVMRVAHEKIHVFPFKDVRKCWLRAWVEGSLARATEVLENDGEELGDWVAEVVRLVDMALILAGGVGRESTCEWIFAVLERMMEQGEEQRERPAKRRRLSERDTADDAHGKDSSGWKHPDAFPNSTVRAPPLRRPIPRHENLSLADFQAHLNTAAGAQNSTDENLPGDLPQPMIITGALDHWPAISDPSRRWSDPNYLMRKTLGGRRLVPIEIGRSYTDEGWGQGIITFSEFMQKYMFHDQDDASKPAVSRTDDARGHNDDDDAASTITTTTTGGEQTGYLAQHDLFAQIPSLRADIAVPDYCYSTPVPSPSPATKNATAPLPPGHPSFPLLNAWFGPADTISPLHTDPYHNVLAQVVGRKYVRLYPPGQRQRLYPRGVGPDGVDMGNTSEVDVGEAMTVLEGWHGWSFSSSDDDDNDDGVAALSAEEAWAREEDLKMRRFDFEERWPQFAKVEGCCEAVLGPGDALYVPKGWWHYVRSLSPSFSVSFWWD
ncbi:Transcription factor jumonji/aspartyl beta-hydroxylase [Lasiodiplodia theobromae]|uniref:Transcription factor jumonji/aspartyl beta-hydroxylase n=1 Tax=Lasiodiplodia theobromae TaxID=45133 RepID=A0A8H7IRR9_9PEZI|nr:Transcription factor jumonji/aspartyl beta-hydroxylase [Lasiodiplodia theobromae]